MKRSQQKKITIQVRTIRYMLVIRGISQREAARRCGLSESAIGHYEQGRMDISGDRMVKCLQCYGFLIEDFDHFVSGERPIPVVSMRDKCMSLLGQMDDKKLGAVHAMLTSFSY